MPTFGRRLLPAFMLREEGAAGVRGAVSDDPFLNVCLRDSVIQLRPLKGRHYPGLIRLGQVLQID